MTEFIVKILDENQNLLDIVDDYKYISWTRRWQKGKKHEMIISHYSKSAQYLKENNYIEILRNGEREYIGVIEHKNIQLDRQGKATENWNIKGKSILARRICLPPSGTAYDENTGDAESVIRKYIDANVINPADSNRKIDNMILETNQNRGKDITIRARYNKLVEILTDASVAGDIGWEVVSDGDKLIFQFLEGQDKTTNQSSIAPIIFSPDFGNIETQSYEWSKLDRDNLSYVGGQGEGANRTIEKTFLSDNEPSGLDRRENFVDARDLDSSSKLIQRGESELEKQGTEEKFEASILTYGPFQYREDWDLGDIVTVRNVEWNILAHLRIQEINIELDQKEGKIISVSFGAPYDNFIQKINRELSKTNPVLRK